MKYMLKDYSRNEVLEQKCIILPHSYDESMYPAEDFKNDKIIFSYVGHLDDIRTPKLLFMALKDLKNENNDLSNKVHFNFYGNLSDNDKLYLINNDLLDLVSLKNSIDYIESLKVMKKSDWLIHIDANISDVLPYNIFFAAKIADYLGSRKPIFGMTMLDGASADILRVCNELVVSFSKEDIKNYLYLIIYKNYKLNFSDDASYKYNAINVAKMLDELLFKIVK
jgi:glycosyltransferase involved in cell wall biosynthesis